MGWVSAAALLRRAIGILGWASSPASQFGRARDERMERALMDARFDGRPAEAFREWVAGTDARGFALPRLLRHWVRSEPMAALSEAMAYLGEGCMAGTQPLPQSELLNARALAMEALIWAPRMSARSCAAWVERSRKRPMLDLALTGLARAGRWSSWEGLEPVLLTALAAAPAMASVRAKGLGLGMAAGSLAALNALELAIALSRREVDPQAVPDELMRFLFGDEDQARALAQVWPQGAGWRQAADEAQALLLRVRAQASAPRLTDGRESSKEGGGH